MLVIIRGKEFNVEEEPKDYWGWVANGSYDREWAVYDAYLKPEHTFVDLGAWVGSHSMYASTVAKKVIAVEPDPVASKIIVPNLARRSNCTVTHNAIGGESGQITLGSGFLGASTTRANPNAGGGIGAWEKGHTFDVICAGNTWTGKSMVIRAADVHWCRVLSVAL
jgi:23S rRNA U2552 (ribose-2'-O)-methylase RlmE/FtsJ